LVGSAVNAFIMLIGLQFGVNVSTYCLTVDQNTGIYLLKPISIMNALTAEPTKATNFDKFRHLGLL
jgi:hypothetical protein